MPGAHLLEYTDEGRQTAVAIDLLGTLRVDSAGHAVALPRRRRSLLGLLALRAGQVVAVEQLVDGLWGEDAPPTAVRTLHSHVAKLDATLTGGGLGRVIRRRDPGYLLTADRVQVDRERFEELAASGRRHIANGRFAEAVRAYREALGLWRGEPLSDCSVYGWAATDATYLAGLRLDAQEGLLAARLAAGAEEVAAGEVERMAAEHPLRERRWELLMVALQINGRTGDALTTFRRARRTLAEELGTEPGAGLRHVEAGVLGGSTDPRTLLRLARAAEPNRSARRTWALPRSVNQLVGREAAIARVSELLGETRLVTLTGFGGIGKTRLAIEVADAMARDFAEVQFADLAALHRNDLLSTALADVLGVREQPGVPPLQRLVQRIAGARLLIVLDNCEHLVNECAELVHELLTRCPRLKILATSQEALRVPGEYVWPVPALAHPDPATVRTAEDLVGHDAVALFADRARIGSVRALSPEDARAAAVICARCEGLPLAIELAAAQPLPLPELAHRVRDRLTLLADGPPAVRSHHRTLRTTVEWSYGLLTEEERGAVRRFGVFMGPFTREAAQQVCPGPPILGLLSRLVDKSLVKPIVTAAGMRYRLLETIKDYAVEQLAAHPGEYAQARRDHARHFLRRAEEVDRRLQGPDLGPLMAQVPAFHDDLRAAMTWLTCEDPASALRLAAALWRYHYLRGRYREGRDWLESALAAAGPEVPPGVYAKASWAAGKLAALECDYPEAVALAERALGSYENEGDTEGVARAKALLGAIAREQGDYRRAIELSREALACAEAAGDRWGAGHALQLLGFTSWLSGNFVAAAHWSGRAVDLLSQVGDRERLAWCRLDLGAAAHYRGAPAEAAQLLGQALAEFREVRFKEGSAWAENLLALAELDLARPRSALRRLAVSLRLHTELGDRWRQAGVLDALARGSAMLGDLRLAARLLGAAAAIRDAIGTPVPACEITSLKQTRAQIRKEIGPEALEALQTTGRDLEIDRALQELAN